MCHLQELEHFNDREASVVAFHDLDCHFKSFRLFDRYLSSHQIACSQHPWRDVHQPPGLALLKHNPSSSQMELVVWDKIDSDTSIIDWMDATIDMDALMQAPATRIPSHRPGSLALSDLSFQLSLSNDAPFFSSSSPSSSSSKIVVDPVQGWIMSLVGNQLQAPLFVGASEVDRLTDILPLSSSHSPTQKGGILLANWGRGEVSWLEEVDQGAPTPAATIVTFPKEMSPFLLAKSLNSPASVYVVTYPSIAILEMAVDTRQLRLLSEPTSVVNLRGRLGMEAVEHTPRTLLTLFLQNCLAADDSVVVAEHEPVDAVALTGWDQLPWNPSATAEIRELHLPVILSVPGWNCCDFSVSLLSHLQQSQHLLSESEGRLSMELVGIRFVNDCAGPMFPWEKMSLSEVQTSVRATDEWIDALDWNGTEEERQALVVRDPVQSDHPMGLSLWPALEDNAVRYFVYTSPGVGHMETTMAIYYQETIQTPTQTTSRVRVDRCKLVIPWRMSESSECERHHVIPVHVK